MRWIFDMYDLAQDFGGRRLKRRLTAAFAAVVLISAPVREAWQEHLWSKAQDMILTTFDPVAEELTGGEWPGSKVE